MDYTSLVWSANLPTVIFPIYRIQGACMSACARMWVVSTLIFLLFGSAWIFLFIFVWHCYRKKCQKQTNPSTVKGKTNWKTLAPFWKLCYRYKDTRRRIRILSLSTGSRFPFYGYCWGELLVLITVITRFELFYFDWGRQENLLIGCS